jgi:hypothetical protein
MRIRSQDNQGYLSLEPKERGLDGSLRLALKVASHGFAGESAKVWVDKIGADTFLQEVRALESKRQGKATLISLSPGEAVILLRAADSFGHIGVSVDLARPVFVFGRTTRHRVHVEFEMDAGRMAELVAETAEMIEWVPTKPSSLPRSRSETDG